MDNKDLFKGLNNVDDDLIEEAKPSFSRRKKPLTFDRVIKYAVPIAAAVCLLVIGGSVISSQTISSFQSNVKSSSKYVGTKSGNTLGSIYKTPESYGDLFDILERSKEVDYGAMVEDAVEGARATNGTKEIAKEAEDLNEKQDEDYSKTNLMTEGVDESDVVKTNGKYIFAVNNRTISITDITRGEPGETVHFTPSFAAPSDEILEMYVDENKMMLITDHYEKGDKAKDQTICYCYDLTSGAEPKLTGSMKQDGYYYTSRKVGDTVYLFTENYTSKPELLKDVAVSEAGLSEWIPQVNGRLINKDCIYMASENNERGILVSSFNTAKPDECIDAKLVMNGGATIYVSEDAIYFYKKFYKNKTVTEIDALKYKDGKLETGNDTTVAGSILDSFAIKQHNGNVYVLTTDNTRVGNGKGTRTTLNTLFVFDMNLKEVGEVGGIARGESVYAARFVGDYVYFITYEKTDPLFVADISDPTNPKIVGELEVTGFSEYLHKWDDTHILGIGYGDREKGDKSRSIKLVMFDVSDPANPKEENQYLIKNPGYYCEAMHEYKAILASPEKNVIGFAAGDFHMFSYSKDKGFEIIAKSELKEKNTNGYRGLYVGDNLYVASAAEVFKVKK